MAKYKLLNNNSVQNTETGAFIPEDMDNKDWVEYRTWLLEGNIPDREYTLEQLKDQKKQKVNTLKALKSSKLLYNNYWFQTDEKSLTKISGKVLGYVVSKTWPNDFYWTSLENDNISFTTAESFIGFAKLVEDHQLKCHYNSQALKALISNAKSEKELDDVDINIGWPW